MSAWVQLHRVPPLYRTETILKMLAGKIGDYTIPTVKGDFFRVHVNLESNKPLVHFVMLTPEGIDNVMIQVKFEKVPCFYAHCGHMGHTYLECGTGEYTEDDLQFGEWMLAEENNWRPGTPRVRATPRGHLARSDWSDQSASRGQGRGRTGRGDGRTTSDMWRRKPRTEETNVSRKRDSAEAGLAQSPLKPLVEEQQEVGNQDAKKKLFLIGNPILQEGSVPPPPPQYVTPKERKKAGSMNNSSPNKQKTDSLDEAHRAQ